MPNWCNNKLTIIVSKGELEQVKDLLFDDKGDFTFNRAFPQPKDLEDWYNWNISNWGTKWDACNVYHKEVFEDEIQIYFDTAWSPPEGWVNAFYEKTLGLDISFDLLFSEEGMDYAGSYVRDEEGKFYTNEGWFYYSVDDDSREVRWDGNSNVWRDLKGRFVCGEDVITSPEYGN